VLGILYLTFQAFPIIFEENHNFNLQSTGLTFLGMAIGMLVGLCTMPYFPKGGTAGTKRHTAGTRRQSSVC